MDDLHLHETTFRDYVHGLWTKHRDDTDHLSDIESTESFDGTAIKRTSQTFETSEGLASQQVMDACLSSH